MKKTIIKLISVVAAAVLLLTLVSCNKTENSTGTTAEETSATPQTISDTTAKELITEVGEGTDGKITVDILCDLSVDSGIRPDADVLTGITYNFSQGETILDALKAVTAANDIIVVETSGYVTGIDGLSTGDAGDYSGWLLMQNGVMPEVGAADCKLEDGDIVQWIYTADYNEYFK